jgi:hypothetical protein
MKTNSYSGGKILQNLAPFFDKRLLDRLAKKSGFRKRSPKKITPFGFIVGFIQACLSRGVFTYSSWAASIGNLTGKFPSKQALWERMGKDAADFAKAAFSHCFTQRLSATIGKCPVLKPFKRVLLQDSTTLSLPQHLVDYYPGNRTKGVQKAVARLQCILNVATMHWLHIGLEAFTDNDQKSSGIVVPLLKKGDLLLRDLGYFVLEVFRQIKQQQAFFISRLHYKVNLYDLNGKPLTWKQLCRRGRQSVVDQIIYIGQKQQVAVRLVMLKVPAKVANERVRRAKTDKDKRVNHSQDYYQRLHYDLYITNVDEQVATAKQIAQLYRVRWQIEVLFKSWKRKGFGVQRIPWEAPAGADIECINTMLYLMLLWMCVAVQQVYCRYCNPIRNRFGKCLSLLKLSIFVAKNFDALLWLSKHQLLQQLLKHCCYEKRKDRTHMTDFIFSIQLDDQLP